MQFIFSPFWGGMSDRYGRKKILMVGILGNALSLIVLGLAQSMWVVFASRAIEGILSAATFPTAMAYISDSTTQEERGGGMGVIGAAMGVGMVLGPGLGGLLAGHSLSTPFFLAATMSILSLISIWFVLPESLPQERRAMEVRKFRGPQLSILWKALCGPIGVLLVLAFLVNFALASFEGIFGLSADKRYGYGPAQVGSVLVVVGVISSLVQMILTGPATRKLGEATVIKLSLVASAAGLVLMALSPNNILVSITVGFFVFSTAMLRPSIFSLTSKKTQSGQGMALGLNSSFQSLGRVIGPLWAGTMFDLHITLPYLSAALIMLAAFVFSLFTMRAEQGQGVPTPVSTNPQSSPATSRMGDD
jgi:DHA1 family multidrug resistance protein-like MFS transporter